MVRWSGSAILVIVPLPTTMVLLSDEVTTRSSGLSGASGSLLPSLRELPLAVAVLV